MLVCVLVPNWGCFFVFWILFGWTVLCYWMFGIEWYIYVVFVCGFVSMLFKLFTLLIICYL